MLPTPLAPLDAEREDDCMLGSEAVADEGDRIDPDEEPDGEFEDDEEEDLDELELEGESTPVGLAEPV